MVKNIKDKKYLLTEINQINVEVQKLYTLDVISKEKKYSFFVKTTNGRVIKIGCQTPTAYWNTSGIIMAKLRKQIREHFEVNYKHNGK